MRAKVKSLSKEYKKNSSYKLHELFHGDPVGIRTLDLLIRSQSLYPAELPSHVWDHILNGYNPVLAGAEGLEPSTDGFGDRYSTN